jgi:electron transfer flavoprotein beta subunit
MAGSRRQHVADRDRTVRILCLAKLVPDVDQLRYDSIRNVLVREHVRLILNPEDATAVATALELRRVAPDVRIETVSMAPPGAIPHLEDLVRRGVDRATLITDPRCAGSDTWVTSKVLAHYLATQDYDCVFCGTQTLDSGTGQVPAEVAESLGLPLMVGISSLVDLDPREGNAVVDVDVEAALMRFAIALPAVLGFQYDPRRKLPPMRYENLNRDVSGLVAVLGAAELGIDESDLGLRGSRTRVRRLATDSLEAKEPLRLRADPEGVDEVYRWLERKGFLQP